MSDAMGSWDDAKIIDPDVQAGGISILKGLLDRLLALVTGIIIASMPTVANSIKVSPVGGTKAVTTSGTAVPLVATATDAQSIFVQAKTGNTGAIYLGDSAVDKASSKQITLLQSQAVTFGQDGGYKLDVNEFYIDADNNNDGVDFVYMA